MLVDHPVRRRVNPRNLPSLPNVDTSLHTVGLQCLRKHSRAAQRVGVVEIETEVAQREERRRLLEEVLTDDIDQCAGVAECLEILVDRHRHAVDLPDCQEELAQPGEQFLKRDKPGRVLGP